MSRLVRPLAIVLTAAVAAAVMLLWVRSYSVSGRDLEIMAASIRWWTLPLLLLLLAAHVSLASYRWSRIEAALGAEFPRFRTAFAAGAIALGLGTLLPGLLTNVAARSLSNRVGGTGAVRGALSGAIDQLSDLAIVILFLPAGLAGLAFQSLTLYLATVAMSTVLGFAGLSIAPKMIGTLGRFSPLRTLGKAQLRPDILRPIYWLSVLRFACLTGLTLLIHFATGAATVSATIIAIPLVTLAISLAMLPGGLGVSEWSFSAVFAAMNVRQEQIVLFVLGNRILLSAAALLLMVLALCHAAVSAGRRRSPASVLPLSV